MAYTDDPLIERGAKLERVATGATWSEGPLWLAGQQVVRWSDIPGNRILEFRPADSSTRVYREDVEFTNGRTLDLDGTVLQCSHGRRAVEREVDGVPETVVDRWNGVRFNSPNDIVVSSDGAIWFTDPAYGIIQPAEGHPGEREYGDHYVFRYVPSSGELHPVVMDMEDPNGLAFSPDESVLYVSDTSAALDPRGKHHIRAYDVVDGRRCKNGRTLAVIEPGVPDGFRVDAKGRIWTSSEDSVQILNPEGALLARIAVPERIGNLCFGGPDGRDLYIAASTSLYRIRTTTTDAAARSRAAAEIAV